MMKDWTLEELIVAAITMEHDLRGSWSGDYTYRIFELIHICENIADFTHDKKDKFVDALKGTPDFVAVATHDIEVCNNELSEVRNFDGRVFRDSGLFYEMEMSDDGKTKRVIEFLTDTVNCDDYHWFQRETND